MRDLTIGLAAGGFQDAAEAIRALDSHVRQLADRIIKLEQDRMDLRERVTDLERALEYHTTRDH